jgi:hypothetical protein
MTPRSRDRDIEERIQADTRSLRAASLSGLPSLASTLVRLEDTQPTASRRRTSRQGDIMIPHSTRKRWLPAVITLAILTVAGGVLAATTTGLISVSVDTEGKTDEEVESEIHDQLVNDGVQQPSVDFQRTGDRTSVDIEGERDGKQLRIVQRHRGGDPGVVTIEPPALDTTREPGMTDAELAAKIQAQMDELGLDGEAIVEDGAVRIRALKRVQDCGGQPCPE